MLHTWTAFNRKKLCPRFIINSSWVYIFNSSALAVRWNFRWKKNIELCSKTFSEVKNKLLTFLLNHNWSFPSRQRYKILGQQLASAWTFEVTVWSVLVRRQLKRMGRERTWTVSKEMVYTVCILFQYIQIWFLTHALCSTFAPSRDCQRQPAFRTSIGRAAGQSWLPLPLLGLA